MAKQVGKSWHQSKTIWAGIFQAIIGLLGAGVLALETGLTPETLGALVVGIKGIVDIILRIKTYEPVI